MAEDKPFDSELVMSEKNYAGRIAATAAKYAALLGGIYYVCKDDKDFIAAGICGVGYVLADTIKEVLRESAELSKLSVLEKELEEKREE